MEQKDVGEQDSCPGCGGIMNTGYVVGSSVLWWTKKEPNIRVTKKDGNILLDSKVWGRGWAHVQGKRCSNCGLSIIKSST